MSSQPGRHTYGHSTIEGSARVQLGDINSYTYNYSILDARNAIYKNTLTVTLREILNHKSLTGRFAMFPASKIFTQPLLESITLQIETLEKYLSSMQEIEQRQIRIANSLSKRSQMFENALVNPKVASHVNVTNNLIARLLQLAKSRCTNPESVSCLDDFCDLMDRLGMQIAARLSLDKAVEHLPSDTVNEQAEAQQPSASASISSDPATINSSEPPASTEEHAAVAGTMEDQEYLYATQDFWRQLALVLRKMIQIHYRSWLEPLKLTAVMTLFYLMVFGVFSILGPSPKDFDKDFGNMARTFYLFQRLGPLLLVIWIVIGVFMTRRARARRRTSANITDPSTG